MELRVIAIGRSMPGWVGDGWREYARRMPRHLPLELVELAPARSGGKLGRRQEGEALLSRCPPHAVRIALDRGGIAWSTRELAARLDQWQRVGSPVCFLIGGADGLDPVVLEQSSQRWSLSRLTFPHMLVRVLLAEQLYRSWTVLTGHPYHRD